MSTLGFEDYVEPLKVYLHKYREVSWMALGVQYTLYCIVLVKNRYKACISLDLIAIIRMLYSASVSVFKAISYCVNISSLATL